jgi:hypothetical protein
MFVVLYFIVCYEAHEGMSGNPEYARVREEEEAFLVVGEKNMRNVSHCIRPYDSFRQLINVTCTGKTEQAQHVLNFTNLFS